MAVAEPVTRAPNRSAHRTRSPASGRSGLPYLYERIRLRGAPIAVAITLTVGTLTGWPNGPWVPVSCTVIMIHAFYLHRTGAEPGSVTLLVDGTAVGVATLTMGIPVVTATGMCFVAVVASVLTSGRRAIVVAVYTSVWIGLSFLVAYGGLKTPYEPESKVVIELVAVIFFTITVSVVVAAVMIQLQRTDTMRSEAAAALASSNEQLGEMIAAKDRFVASISHELRTPLTAVIGLAQELSGPANGFSEEDLHEFHQMIAGEAEEVARIVEDLLVAARADVGKVKVFPQRVDLVSLATEAWRATSGVIDPRIATIGDTHAHGDPVRIKQIIRNLLVNADRYGGDEVRISVGHQGTTSFVDVMDNGPGVASASLERIFDPYESAHEPREEVHSIGLGLSVSRTLARLMGGDLTYGRRSGWTVFSLTLPAGD